MTSMEPENPRAGIPHLDHAIGTFDPGNVILLASRSRIGRTALATFIAGNAAIEQGHAVAFLSLDLGAEELTRRFVAARGEVGISRLREGCLEDHEYSRLARVDAELRRAPIYIDETSGLRSDQLRTRAKALAAQYGIRLLIIDGLEQLNMAEDGAPWSAAPLLLELKAIARELQLPTVVLTRLRCPDDIPKDNRPTVDELADPALIDLADIVLLIHRRVSDGSRPPERDAAEIIVARVNCSRAVSVKFLRECAAFEPEASGA